MEKARKHKQKNFLKRQNFMLKLIILGTVPALGFFLNFKIHIQIN